MYKSILQFNEFGVEILEKVIKEFIEESNQDIGDLVMSLEKPLKELQCNLIAETLEIIDEIYRKDTVRKKNWNIIRQNDTNKFMATCGEVNYKRTYFKSKATGERAYLTDKAAGIKPHMRISNDVVIKTLENVVDSSYRLSGENAVYTEDKISKQAVMKQVHELEIPEVKKTLKEKKEVRVLYIDADEDHVSLQFNKKKGDLGKDKNGRKQNTIMPRLIYLYEGIEKEGPSSKRNKLINKHYFGGVYNNSEELWDEVVCYIEEYYDSDKLEKIYISGDGASWIKKGIDMIGSKCRFILDKYHLNKYIVQATSHLKDSINDAREKIYDAFSMEDKEGIKEIFRIIESITENETKKKVVEKSKRYILNHWNGIIIKNEDEDARLGCSAEGHISHVLSSRMSSRPLGWSKVGADKMSRLRVYKANGGNIYDLVMYKKEKEEREITEEIKEQFDKAIKKKRQNYTDVWNNQPVATQMGKRNGLYYELKGLRGICG